MLAARRSHKPHIASSGQDRSIICLKAFLRPALDIATSMRAVCLEAQTDNVNRYRTPHSSPLLNTIDPRLYCAVKVAFHSF